MLYGIAGTVISYSKMVCTTYIARHNGHGNRVIAAVITAWVLAFVSRIAGYFKISTNGVKDNGKGTKMGP